MGGKDSGGDSGAMQMQPMQSTVTSTAVDPSREQGAIEAPQQGRPPTVTPPPPPPSTGDVAASTLAVPDFLLQRGPLQPQPGPPKRSKLQKTKTETGQSGTRPNPTAGSV
jgi:hypothetical protein